MQKELHMRTELFAEAGKATPPVVVSGAMWAGMPLDDLIKIATLVYICLQIGYLLFKYWRMWRSGSVQSGSVQPDDEP